MQVNINLVNFSLPPFTAPDAAPNITEIASPTSTSIRISWDPPPLELQTGILTDYLVFYTANPELSMDILQPLPSPSTTITLTDLNISTDYTVYVAATTVAGVGPADVAVVMTLNDYTHQILNLIVLCPRLLQLLIQSLVDFLRGREEREEEEKEKEEKEVVKGIVWMDVCPHLSLCVGTADSTVQ